VPLRRAPAPLRLLVVPALRDGLPWLHTAQVASQGWRGCGLHGLLDALELRVGVPGPSLSAVDRLVAQRHRLEAAAPSLLAASMAVDPWGTARRMLTLRDELQLAGWHHRRLSGTPLLDALQAVEDAGPIGPGLGDRFLAIADQAPSSPLHVTLAGAADDLPTAVRAALRLDGVHLDELERPSQAAADSDLGRLQRALLHDTTTELVGDGTVRLLDAATPWEAAEHVAAQLEDGDTAWVIAAAGRDLDAGRHRHGKPRFGVAAEALEPTARLVLWHHLVLHCEPRSAVDAHALATLEGGPLPPGVGRRLAGALENEPSPWGTAWRQAVEDAASQAARRAYDAASSPEEGAQAAMQAAGAVRETVERWFPRPSGASGASDAVSILEALVDDPRVGELAGQLARLAAADAGPLTRRRVGEWMQLLGDPSQSGPAEAGHPAWTRSPESCLAAPHVVWWGFVQGRDVPRSPWSPADRAALVACGVELPDPDAVRRRERAGWLNAIRAAQRTVFLVRWRAEGGQQVAEHPLHHELIARVGEASLRRCQWVPEPRGELVSQRRPPAPRGVWRIDKNLVDARSRLSPTSIDALLTCPLRWTLRYQAGLRPGRSQGPMDGARLAGTLAHRVLQDVLLGPDAVDVRTAMVEEVEALAQQAFAAGVRSIAPAYDAPGQAQERDRMQGHVVRAATEVVHQLRAGGWWPVGVEEPVHGRFAGTDLRGNADLVVAREGGELAVIDIKLGRYAARREEVAGGQALQLALYASALRTTPSVWPSAGYLIVQAGRLIASSAAFPEAVVPPSTPTLERTVELADAGFRQWLDVLRAGEIHARHPDIAEPHPVVDNPLTDRPAPCGYCDFATLCQVRSA